VRMADTIYDSWEAPPLVIPNRTRLFSLTPIGVGTPDVESLSGYIARLAQAHVVSVGNLLGRGLMGRKHAVANTKSATTVRFGGHGFHALGNAINGFDWRARKWAKEISVATGRSDIEQLTLIPFTKVLSGMFLFKPHRAWCPVCYEEERKSGIVYEQLAWAMKLVTVCPRHRTALVDNCRFCNRRQPALAVFSCPGYCSHCGRWLGAEETHSPGDHPNRYAEPSQYDLYASIAVGELLAVVRSARRLSLARFRNNLRICATRLAEGNPNSLADLTGTSKSAIQSWIATRMRPRLDVLLRISSVIGISIAALLTTRRLAAVDWNRVADHCPAIARNGKRYTSSDDVRRKMQMALHDSTPCSIRELSRRLGFQRPEQLYQADAALCHRITIRYRNCTRTHWWRMPGANRISELTTIRRLLENSLAMDPPIPVRQIAGDLGYANGGFIHKKFPELCHAIAEKAAAFKAKELARLRCAVAAACDEEPPPTLHNLTERLGFRSSTVLRDRFPQLTDRLLAARLEHKQKSDSQRLKTELVCVAHGENAPSLSSVSRRLNVSRSSLVDRWPELCRAITARYAQHRTEIKAQKLASVDENARRIAKGLQKQGLRPTHKRIRALLPSGSIKNWAVLQAAVKKAQRLLGMDRR
jgi:transcriptional regulator with XRE-family HTH domain/AraC-like DNA-binding protein